MSDEASSGDGPGVRIRGIYTTALTELLRDGNAVVQASPPIRERFDEAFPTALADVELETTGDRQGVGVVGAEQAVERVVDRLASVGRDALWWHDGTPRGAVFDARVTETLGSGAVVDLGPRAGFLPYSRVDDHVTEDDELRVQVVDPVPPWSDDRPVVAGGLRVAGSLVALVRDRGEGGSGGPRSGAAPELADVLPTDPPSGWSTRWERAAEDADLETMDAALERAGERAEELVSALDGTGDGSGPLATTDATAWVWFGRESRFALDDCRRAVTTTMPGHHRIKAGDDRASTAVDFAEGFCAFGSDDEPDGDAFPFALVTGQFGPREGESVAIEHGKPAGHCITLGRGEVSALEPDGSVTLRREMSAGGTYDALGIERRAGDEAITRFREGRWWYPTVYRGADGERRGTYVNVCTPVEVFPDAVRYVDLHVDVVKHADGTVERVDEDELEEAVEAGHVTAELAGKAREVAAAVENAL